MRREYKGPSKLDLKRINNDTKYITFIKMILIMPGYRFLYHFRKIQNRSFGSILDKLLIIPLKRKYGIEISNRVQIGHGFYMSHPYNITINSGSIMGNNVTICKGATVGSEARGIRKGAPTIGNNVYIGINATVVGNITVGDNVLIAPNTFVNRNVENDSIVFGNPCIIKKKVNATEGYVINRI